MNTRQKNILKSIVSEYQATGQPVASQVLVKKYNFDLSPATIRSEMLELDKEGMLEQPYHSAGRIPTTSAYRMLVDEMMQGQDIHLKDGEKIRRKIMEFEPENLIASEMAKILAEFSHNLGLSASLAKDLDFHEAGFSSLLDDEELARPQSVADILHGFDALEKELGDLFGETRADIEVFIGEENPIKNFKCCSLVLGGYESPKDKGFIGILGPKRMDYERNIFLVDEFKKLMKNLN